MIKETFQGPTEYNQYVRNILLFTHLRAYNGQCQIWKDEDIEAIKYIGDCGYQNGDFSKIDKERFSSSLNILKQAEKEYGETVYWFRETFGDLSSEEVLRAFGFDEPEDIDGNDYVASDLDYSLADLPKNENYPVSFPVITILGDGKFKTTHVYPADFNDAAKLENFDWLENNIRKFWTKGVGTIW